VPKTSGGGRTLVRHTIPLGIVIFLVLPEKHYKEKSKNAQKAEAPYPHEDKAEPTERDDGRNITNGDHKSNYKKKIALHSLMMMDIRCFLSINNKDFFKYSFLGRLSSPVSAN